MRPEHVATELKVNVTQGLGSSEAKKRLEQYGTNELAAKKKLNPIIIFLNQFKSFIIYILLFAIAVSLLSGEKVDALVILIIVVFNAVFGFLQEYKAEKAIDALKKLSGLQATVIRDGKRQKVDAKFLVPGDIILLEEGDKIPADARLIEVAMLQVSEASLTGEAVAVTKDIKEVTGEHPLAEQKGMVFSGTAVTRGRGKAIITSTGMKTEIGKIATMITEVEAELTPLQKQLENLGKWIGSATIGICIIVFVAGVLKEGLTSLLMAGSYLEFVVQAKHWFLTAIALAVAAVPEGLPAIVTIALAIGVRKMVQKNALIRRLPSVETLGETTVICSDKTGTLTMNQMTVRKGMLGLDEFDVTGEHTNGLLLFDGKRPTGKQAKDAELLFRCGILCNDSSMHDENGTTVLQGDPTESSLLVSGKKAGLNHMALQHTWKRVGEEPFDSTRKMMSTFNTGPDKKTYVFTKGAPEHLLKASTKILVAGKVVKLTSKHRKTILDTNTKFAKQALRVLAFGYKVKGKGKAEADLIFLGLQGMIDPPHKEVPDAIKLCHEAGIRVIMITGDNLHTAEAIATEIGIEGKSIEGSDFSKMSEQEQRTVLRDTNIFARVEPAHKMLIVSLLQDQGQIVAMTGDGVNDAPAIKKADLGIAMGITGTDVAKESSDMVLQDDNFASIVHAIEEGRGIYANITKFVNYLLSSNVAEVLVIFLAIIFGWPLPMTAIMLLWLNLVTDGLPALALSVDPNPGDLMKRPPKDSKKGIMSKAMVFNICLVSSLITIAVLALMYWAMQVYHPDKPDLIAHIQTIAFTGIIVMELVRLQAIRMEFKLSPFSNGYLVLAVIASIGLQLLVVYSPLAKFFGTIPLNPLDWLAIGIATVGVFIAMMIGKFFEHKVLKLGSW